MLLAPMVGRLRRRLLPQLCQRRGLRLPSQLLQLPALRWAAVPALR